MELMAKDFSLSSNNRERLTGKAEAIDEEDVLS